jgi:two-component system response regulator PilR (NtrC family)
VVDDDRPVLQLILTFLRREGYAAEGFQDPWEALAAFARRTFSMVITDLTMPGMDGLTLLEKLREIDPKARTVVITGYGDKDQAVRALRLGVSDFLDKPLDLQVLKQVISRALGT